MTKAASLPLGLIFLLATAAVPWAQTPPTDTAVAEAVRRQHDTLVLRQKLDEAKVARDSKDLGAAAKLYDYAYTLVQSIGEASIEPERAETVGGLTAVRMELARAAQKIGDLKEADTQVTRVLKVDPKNSEALAFQRNLGQLREDQKGRIPTAAAVERAGQIVVDRTDAATLMQDGRLLYEMGKLDEAETKLKAAIALDPENKAAFYYLSLVKEGRYSEAERRREQSSKNAIVEIAQKWERPTDGEKLNIPNAYARSEDIHTGKGRQIIVNKLDRIRMDNVLYDSVGLGEVVRNLNDEARKRDPEKKGINFLINPNAEVAAAPVLAAPTVDPATGLTITPPLAPAPVAPTEGVPDISQTMVKINPALTDVRLADVLDAIVKVADKPITYSILDYGVMFSLKGRQVPQLETRIFTVDPNTFYQGLESVGASSFGSTSGGGGGGGGGGGRGGGGNRGGGGGGGGGQGNTGTFAAPRVNVAGGGDGGGGGTASATGTGLRFLTLTNSTAEISLAVRTFFFTLGVDLTTPGKNVFFSDRANKLFVRATAEELDIIEQAIQVLNTAPYQVNIKSRFVEITQNDNRALGFEWMLGNVLMNSGSLGMQAGTAPSYQGASTAANPEGTFPGSVLSGTAKAAQASDGNLTGTALRNGGIGNLPVAPALATFTGILTDPQFRMVLHALEQRDGVDELSSPEVTTLNGRQAQVQMVDLRRIVTDNDLTQTATGGTAGGTVAGGAVQQTGAAPTLNYISEDIPLGPVLDVVPYVSADGYTIQLAIIPTLTEFIGYDDPGQFVPQAQAVSGGTLGIPITGTLPLPHFRLRQVTTSAIVWDGQTVVLGGLISENVARLRDKVPVLGDLPLLGKFFRSEAASTQKRNLVIFVTPTLVDAAGNRLHSPDEMPFVQTSFPLQRPPMPNQGETTLTNAMSLPNPAPASR